MGGTVDYWAKTALVCRLATTKTASDMVAALEAAITRAEKLIGGPLEADCVNPVTGQPEPLVIVTDNGPAMRSTAVARWFQQRIWLIHVRTGIGHQRPTAWSNDGSSR